MNGWRLLTSRYGLGAVVKHLAKLLFSAMADRQTLSRQLTMTRDVWKMAVAVRTWRTPI